MTLLFTQCDEIEVKNRVIPNNTELDQVSHDPVIVTADMLVDQGVVTTAAADTTVLFLRHQRHHQMAEDVRDDVIELTQVQGVIAPDQNGDHILNPQ